MALISRYRSSLEYPYNLLQAVDSRFDIQRGYKPPKDLAGTLAYIFQTYLSEREEDILHRRYMQKETLQAIADSLNLTKERIRQLEAKALSTLRTEEVWDILFYGMAGYLQFKVFNAVRITQQNLQPMLKDALSGLENSYKLIGDLSQQVAIYLEDDIICLKLSARSYQALKRAGVNTIADIVALTPSQLRNIFNLGAVSFKEIVGALESHGFSLAKE